MATEVIRFTRFPKDGLDAQPHRVYLREKWADAWVEVPYLWCDEANWATAPSISTATLHWRFGHGVQHDEWFAQWYTRLTGRLRWYVKIEYDVHPIERDFVAVAGPLVWVGTLEQDATAQFGSKEIWLVAGRQQKESGEQQLLCYGLEQTLARVPIDKAFWYDNTGVLRTSPRCFTFNAPDVQGRAIGNLNDVVPFPLAFDLNPVTTDLARDWSTRDIARYLASQFPPLDAAGNTIISLTIADITILPDGDQPVFDPTGMSLWEALCSLVARTRMLGLFAEYVAGAGGAADSIRLQLYSLAGADLQAGEIEIPANTSQVRIDYESDADITGAGIKLSTLQAVDQFVLRGARRTSTCSLSRPDDTLFHGWRMGTAEPDEADYEAAGSIAGAYAGLDTDEKQRLNAEVRASERLHEVYRYFVHGGKAWDQFAGDGEGGAQLPVFPDDVDAAAAFPVNPRELFVLTCLMLQAGKNFEDLGSEADPEPPALLVDNANNREPPLVALKRPAASSPDEYWIEGCKVGENAELEARDEIDNRRFSTRVEVPHQAYGLYVHVEGQPQHALAKTDFTPLAVDPLVGSYDWREMIVTVSFQDDRYCEGRWPPDNLLPVAVAANTHVRRQILYAGDEYRQDWLVPNTVVRVRADNGTLIRSTGGFIQNDKQKLIDRAQQIFNYFGQTRRAIAFSTGRITTALERGEYVVEIGDLNRVAVGSVITAISISSPPGDEVPRQSFETSFLELEAVQP